MASEISERSDVVGAFETANQVSMPFGGGLLVTVGLENSEY